MSFFTRNKSILAIDIHTTDVRIAQIDNNHVITHMQSSPLPPGLFEQDRIIEPMKISEIILESLKQFPKFSEDSVFIVPDIFCFSNIISLPLDTKKENQRELIQQQITQKIPFSIDDLYWDYYQDITTTTEQKFIFIGVISKIIDQYSIIAEHAKLNLVGIEPEMLTIKELLHPKNNQNAIQSTIVVSSGDTTVSLTLLDKNGEFVFSSIVPFVGGYFTRSIIQSIETQPIDENNTPVLDVASAGTERETVLQTALQSIIDEIKKAQIYASTNFSLVVEKVVLLGELTLLPDSVNYFTSLLGIQTVLLGPDTLKENQSLLKFSSTQKFIRLIGLSFKKSLPKQEQIILNLLYGKTKKQLQTKNEKTIVPVKKEEPLRAEPITKKIIAILFILVTFGILLTIIYFYVIVPIRQR